MVHPHARHMPVHRYHHLPTTMVTHDRDPCLHTRAHAIMLSWRDPSSLMKKRFFPGFKSSTAFLPAHAASRRRWPRTASSKTDLPVETPTREGRRAVGEGGLRGQGERRRRWSERRRSRRATGEATVTGWCGASWAGVSRGCAKRPSSSRLTPSRSSYRCVYLYVVSVFHFCFLFV